MTKIGRAEGYELRKIGMAALPKDWQRIEKYHEDSHRDVVDHSGHMEAHPAPEHYRNFLQSEETLKSQKDPSSGIAKKMIHDISAPDSDAKTRVMTKAYFPKIDSKTRSWVKHPIHGWATMASKSLYDAAGLGENVEQVSTHEHEGIPLTVHTFSPGYKTVYSLREQAGFHDTTPMKKSINPLQVQQIAAMDFLMGNNDRHRNNLMVSDHTDERGYNNLLAIDHERNFQYFKPLNELVRRWDDPKPRGYDLPHDYIAESALHDAKRAAWNNDHWEFYEWWKEVAPKIKEALDKQLSYIKDPSVREHVKRNFERRFDMLQKWASDNTEHNYEEVDFFSKEFPHVVRMVPKPRAAPETIKAIRERLPKDDPEKAIRVLSESAGRKKGVSAQQKLYDLFKSILRELDPDKLVELYEKFRNDTDMKIGNQYVGYQILRHIADRHDKKAAKLLLSFDGGKGRLPVFWKHVFEEMVGGR